MSRYIEILAVQRPFPFAKDENDNIMFSCNFNCRAAAPVDAFEEEIVKILSDLGLATLGTDTFIGPKALSPAAAAAAGPIIHVIDTGGTAPDITHGDDRIERLSAQIVVRASSFTVARTRALAIWRALDGRRNMTVTA